MPYIKKEERENFDDYIKVLANKAKTKGDLNYIICELVGQFILKEKLSYLNISEAIGAVHDAEDELRRRILHVYEYHKSLSDSNGDLDSFNKIKKHMDVIKKLM